MCLVIFASNFKARARCQIKMWVPITGLIRPKFSQNEQQYVNKGWMSGLLLFTIEVNPLPLTHLVFYKYIHYENINLRTTYISACPKRIWSETTSSTFHAVGWMGLFLQTCSISGGDAAKKAVLVRYSDVDTYRASVTCLNKGMVIYLFNHIQAVCSLTLIRKG